MFVYFIIKVVKCSPVPASFLQYLSTSLHWCRSPGGRRDIGVVLEQKKNRWDGRLAAVLLGRGGVAAVREGAEESAPFAVGRSLLPSAMFGEEQGTGDRCRLPSTGGAIAVRQEAEEHRAVHQRGPVPSHGTASERLSWLRTERQCVREPDRDYIFFPLSPLSSLSLLILPSPFLSPRLPLPQVRRGRLTGSPQEREEGGSRAQSRVKYPPACEGRWGM